MMFSVKEQYRLLRARGWTAKDAIRGARIRAAFHAAEEKGLVRIRFVPDPEPYDASFVDTWDDISKESRARWKKKIFDMVDTYGVYGLLGEVKKNSRWEEIYSVWGLIGNELDDGCYNEDAMRECLDEVDHTYAEEALAMSMRATMAAGG